MDDELIFETHISEEMIAKASIMDMLVRRSVRYLDVKDIRSSIEGSW